MEIGLCLATDMDYPTYNHFVKNSWMCVKDGEIVRDLSLKGVFGNK